MKSIIFHCTQEDVPFLPVLKPLLSGKAQTYIDTTTPSTVTELAIKSKSKGMATIVSTSQSLLRLVVPEANNPRISEYSGSFIRSRDTDFLFLDPLDSLVKVPYGKFVYSRFLAKILAPEKWIVEPDFRWELYQPSRHHLLSEFFDSCDLIAIDTETTIGDPDRSLACVGYAGIRLSDGKATMMTVVVPLTDPFNIVFVRHVNANDVPKVLQNGKYDHAYFFRYSAPVRNYAFDTINLFHGWLSELPKDLGFITAFMVRSYKFHKNDGKSGDKYEYYEYNARDCYYTLLACLALLQEIPEYAKANFILEFPLVFPSHLMEMTGLKIDVQRTEELKLRTEREMEDVKRRLGVMVGDINFNPRSSQQTVRLFGLLGSKDITGSTPPEKDKVANRHPLNKRIIDAIVDYRETAKLRSSYFKEDVNWRGRCFYAVNPHGTDTGRLASRESQYWCGLQIQNIPRDGYSDDDITVKETFIADDGFEFGEADYSQAETRDTAYLSGDTSLISTITDEARDFHSYNTSAFFGLEYQTVCKSYWDDSSEDYEPQWVHKRLNKAIIDIAKRTNHGANYNMGAQVLLDTMGIANVIRARELLGLPKHWTLLRVTAHLLAIFDKTYPVIRDPKDGWYGKVINDVVSTGLLVGPTGWTRRCFGNPKSNKHHLNSYVAHPPQSLNAMTLNQAVLAVFVQVWMQHHKNFKLVAQIHDSIFFQYREGYQHLAWKVKELMKIPITVKDTFGISRTFTVPVDLKLGGKRWSEVKPARVLKPKAWTKECVT